jgi:hypothetical protein
MGTSGSYGGPGKGGSLLPPWATPAGGAPEAETSDSQDEDAGKEPPPAQGEKPDIPTATWGAAKSQLTRFGSSGGSTGYLRSAATAYVGAQGGARGASSAAVGGRRSSQALGGFLRFLSTEGPARALESLGLGEHVGSDAPTLLAALVDRLASNGNGLEANVARSALAKTLHRLFEERAVATEGISALAEMSADEVCSVIEEFVAQYIDERLIQVIGDGLQDLPMDEVVLREQEVWDYVRNTVRLDLHDVDVLGLDWTSAQAASLIDRIFTEAHRLIAQA